MLRELLSLFRTENPLSAMADNFASMLARTYGLTIEAGDVLFGKAITPEERTRLYKQDVTINKLERRIRKQVIAHLSLGTNRADLPYCLLLMSLVKDVERIGDYAKNFVELSELGQAPLAEGPLRHELHRVALGVTELLSETLRVVETCDGELATSAYASGRDLCKWCDRLVADVAASDQSAADSVRLAVGARYYKRVAGHLMNVLSSQFMPLHKLDYCDPSAFTRSSPAEQRTARG
jgi:phosphate uptake regulator